jgi:hypothetical protein
MHPGLQSVVTSSRRRGDRGAVSCPKRHAARRHRRALPLPPNRCASRRACRAACCAARGHCRPAGPGVTSPVRASGAPVGVTSGRLGRHHPHHLRHPRWPAASRQLSRRHRRRRWPYRSNKGAPPRALRGGQVRRSSARAAGRTAGPGPVPVRGRAGPGRRRGRHPIDRRARRATAASLDESAGGVSGLRPAARPPALQSGRSSPRGSAPRPGAGRRPSTTSGSGRGCAA